MIRSLSSSSDSSLHVPSSSSVFQVPMFIFSFCILFCFIFRLCLLFCLPFPVILCLVLSLLFYLILFCIYGPRFFPFFFSVSSFPCTRFHRSLSLVFPPSLSPTNHSNIQWSFLYRSFHPSSHSAYPSLTLCITSPLSLCHSLSLSTLPSLSLSHLSSSPHLIYPSHPVVPFIFLSQILISNLHWSTFPSFPLIRPPHFRLSHQCSSSPYLIYLSPFLDRYPGWVTYREGPSHSEVNEEVPPPPPPPLSGPMNKDCLRPSLIDGPLSPFLLSHWGSHLPLQ